MFWEILRKEEIEKCKAVLGSETIFISGEGDVEWLFINYHKFFGFNKISPIPDSNTESTYGDYFAWQGNRRKRVELELLGNSFFLHKPEVRQQIDVLVAGYIPSKKRSPHWTDLEGKQIIDLSQWFNIHIIKGIQEEMWIREFVKNYEREVHDPFCHARDMENWLEKREQAVNEFWLQTEEILHHLEGV